MKTIRPVHILSGDLWGGAEAQVYFLCKNMIQSYSDLVIPSVLLSNSGALKDKLEASNISTQIALESDGFLKLLKTGYKFAKAQKSNLIISHGYKQGIAGFILSKLLLLPWIHYIHGTSENYTGAKKYKMAIYSCLERFLMRASADRIVTVSKKIGDDLNISNLSKHRVIYNAAENNTKKNPSITKDSEGINISWLGRLNPVKRPDLAILGFLYFLEHAPVRDSSVTLNIYGTGPLDSKLKDICNGHPLINLLGFTEDPEQVISMSSFILLTSDSEGIPTVILEAMHANVPVVSRFVGGIPEIQALVPEYPILEIKDGTTHACGLAIEQAVKELVDLKSKAKKCNSDFFSLNRLTEDHLRLYKELL